MPTFFGKDQLSPDQRDRWTSACALYDRVMNADNGADDRAQLGAQADAQADAQSGADCRQTHGATLEPRSPLSHPQFFGNQPGHPKSALFARLLDGKLPLKYRPPTSFSYPWYAVIEDDGPWEVERVDRCKTVDDFMYATDQSDGPALDPSTEWTDPHPMLEINQCGWLLADRVNDHCAIVSFGAWMSAGWTWRLVREKIPATSSDCFIASWHNPALQRITTLQDLHLEQRWHVMENARRASLVLSPEEVEERTDALVQQWLTDLGYSADEAGNLWVELWRLHHHGRPQNTSIYFEPPRPDGCIDPA